MDIIDRGSDVLDRLQAWALGHPLIRALLLESNRATPGASRDLFSDYDVLLVISDLDQFMSDDRWLHDFGTPLVRLPDSDVLYDRLESHARLVLYDDGTKIDYIIWHVDLLERTLQEPQLPDVLDVGYQVLVDKDDRARHLRPPTYMAHIPRRPAEVEFHALTEEFWWESTYVAKNLWRDELVQAKYNLDMVMKLQLLVKLLEWRVEIDHNWSVRPGVLGKGLKKLLDQTTWSDLASTYVGASIEENWEALFATTRLFRRVAREVAGALGYAYLDDLDAGVMDYLQTVRALER